MTTALLEHPLPRFIRTRWQGQVPLRRLFWWDLLSVGTLINAWVAVIALILLAKGLDSMFWLILHLAIIPYNLFLVMSVWRHEQATVLSQSVVLGWLMLTLLI